MVPIFPTPQWSLQPDPQGFRSYANVSNALEFNRRGKYRKLAVAVPTGLFPLMQDVFKIDPAKPCSLVLDDVGTKEDPQWVFSLVIGEVEEMYDLWYYTRGSLPQWILKS